jgi:RHS repeat-associated protein
VVSVVATSDDNALTIMTAQGFTGRMTGANYDSTTGGDHSVGLADKLQATAGTATLLAWRQSVNASDRWAGITFALRPVPANIPPTVSLTSPTGGATFTAPATITLTATAADSDGTITKVEFFHGGTNLIATVTAAPYTFSWTNVAAASYSLTAKATDNSTATTTSAPVNVTVNAAAVAQLHYIHSDHLNTPRVITNQASQVVWRWDHTEPFGADPANSNPSGLGTFEFNLRLPGQYFDKETNLHYNYFRDYDPGIGRYVQSDPIGLEGGINTYGYARANPLTLIDPDGLQSAEMQGRERSNPRTDRERPGPTKPPTDDKVKAAAIYEACVLNCVNRKESEAQLFCGAATAIVGVMVVAGGQPGLVVPVICIGALACPPFAAAVSPPRANCERECSWKPNGGIR